MPPEGRPADLHYPKGGIDRSRQVARQPWRPGPRRPDGEPTRIYTTHEAVNVRGYDPLTRRFRGGSRCGIGHYLDSAVVAGWHVQHLASIANTDSTGMVQSSLLGRLVTGIAVSQGRVFSFQPGGTSFTEATNAASTTPPLSFSGVMQSAPNNQDLWIVDGTRYRVYSPLTPANTISDWTTTAGSLPRADGYPTEGCRLITTWRGRTVLSGLLHDPANWFMSRVSDPQDFDYGAPVEDDPTIAVAGNNSRLGFIGDIITALIAYNDDLIIFGGQKSIWMMRGDPMTNGELHLVTSSIGIAFGAAYCQGPDGTVYFVSNTGAIYAMPPGRTPERISAPIDSFAEQVDTGENWIHLQWNEPMKGFHVFVTDLTDPTEDATHFFWEAPLNAWVKDKFADGKLNPLASCVLDGNRPGDRVVLIGSKTGHVNYYNPDADTDCGEEIESEVWIGPFLTANLDEVPLRSLQGVLAEDSDDVEWAVFAGDTAEAAFAASDAGEEPVAEGVFESGRNPTELVRSTAYAQYVRLRSVGRWAMESITAVFGPNLSKVRRRNY